MTRRILYLHGFASSPKSRKAQFFRERFAGTGASLEIPDLAEGNFEQLTISGQLAVIDRLAGGERVSLIGSSMGGYIAALYAARHPEIEKVVLLAPAFGFARRWMESLEPEKLREWKRSGRLSFYHYGDQRERPLSYRLIEDGVQYEEYPDVRQPALVFHGSKDTSVPAEYSVEFAAGRANVRLELVESDHELTDVLDRMWEKVRQFLLPGVPGRAPAGGSQGW